MLGSELFGFWLGTASTGTGCGGTDCGQPRARASAVRAGIPPTYFPGESAAKLNVEADFPGLDPSSQQASDIERFRWFSDDWLALDDADTRLIVDMRYSQIPNMIKGLWGIEVQLTADKSAHILWKVQRATGSRELRIFKEQLLGHGARTLPTTGGASNDQ